MSRRTARHRLSVKNTTLLRYWLQHNYRALRNWLYKHGWD